MKLKKTYIVPAVAVAGIGLSLLMISSVGAQTNTNPHSTLISRIAQKFNLQEAEVQKVFDEVHQERHARMQDEIENRLNQAIKDGKITDAQKTAILNKQKEMMSQKEQTLQNIKDLTPEERQQEMEKKRIEFKTWAEKNGLSEETLKDLMIGFKFKAHHGFGNKMMIVQ